MENQDVTKLYTMFSYFFTTVGQVLHSHWMPGKVLDLNTSQVHQRTLISLTEFQHVTEKPENLNTCRCSLSSLLRQAVHLWQPYIFGGCKAVSLFAKRKTCPVSKHESKQLLLLSVGQDHIPPRCSEHHYAATCPAGTCQDKASAIKAADGSLGRLKPGLAWTHHLWCC